MAIYNDKNNKKNQEYKKANIKRISFDIPKKDFPPIKALCESRGETVNGYIKRLIKEDMKKCAKLGDSVVPP